MRDSVKIIALVGPTASGKTGIAVQLAQILNGEVISADSRLIYKDFNIGTAKPTIEEMENIPHHMIDVADPKDTYTVGLYKEQAEAVIDDIIGRGKVPIVAGGTGFYTKALLAGLDMPKVEPDEEFRQELDEFASLHGREALHNRLKEIDPVMAEKLHYNDKFRIIRALEVHKALGIPMSEAQKLKPPKYDVLYIGLNAQDREYLYGRVNKRVDIMIEQGLVEEVKNLINKYGKTVSLLKTLGYKEICEYIDGILSLEDSIELIKKDTRNFAKRQLTWFRANPEINWFYIDKMSGEQICKEIIKLYNV